LLLALFISSGFLAACKGAVWFEGYTPQEPKEIQLNMQHIENPIVNASAPTCHLLLNETGPDSANLTISIGTVALFYQNGNFSTWFSIDSKPPEELASILKTEPSAAGEFYSRQYNITLNEKHESNAIGKATGVSVINKEPKVRLTEKDVINKIIDAQKNPDKKESEIVKLFSCNGQAIIHPPSSLKLPELLIYFVHAEKHSTFGTQDFMHIVAQRETPEGYRFVPSAFVYDAPEATDFWKKYFAGTPSASNLQLVKKEELEVQLHGNMLFAGWTVTIPLLPPIYALPPACVMLEGYGSLRTDSHVLDLASGYKMVDEFNGFDAFVTFLHPSTNYSGPGTDGFLTREVISTIYPPKGKTALNATKRGI
jgi:hypothetical protein